MEHKNIVFIKHKGTPNEATLFDNSKVQREEKIWVDAFSRFIETAPYDNHFIYKVPTHIEGWALMCTCGMGAVIVGSDAYRKDASPSSGGTVPGELIVCYSHVNSGKHADGSS